MDERRHAPPYLSAGRVDLLAVGALVGVNPLTLLNADEPLRRELENIIVAAHTRSLERDRWLARQIIVELADALARK